MDSISNVIARGSSLLHVRDEQESAPMSSTMIDLLIVLLVLIFVSLLLVGALYFVRSVRRRRAIERQQLPLHNEKSGSNHRRRLTISTRRGSSIYIYDEKASIFSSPPDSPVIPAPEPIPEIRITFPDEQDESGHRTSGRVVVVRVGETGVGLEPLNEDEQLPAYEKETGGRFHSIDMERIGGLKEKSSWSP